MIFQQLMSGRVTPSHSPIDEGGYGHSDLLKPCWVFD